MRLLHFSQLATVILAASCPASPPPESQEWDVIVVGAGTAGIIVADKLSENGAKTLLLEQGDASYGITGGRERGSWLEGSELSRVDVPGLYSTIFGGSSTLLCKQNVVHAFQACTIGGNSAINAGLYFQPPQSDWDTYFPEGWQSVDVEPAIQRLLMQQPAATADAYNADAVHETFRQWIVGSSGYAEINIAERPSEKDGVFGRPVYNYINGQRGGPVRTYLQSALRRPNFRLVTDSRVKYIERSNQTASAVAVDRGHGKTKTYKLRKNGKVVLSAGALQSPQILMYSGIGPHEILTSLAATEHTPYVNASSWIVQPSVGDGLFDNPNTFIELSSPNFTAYNYSYDDPIAKDSEDYLAHRKGPYSFAGETSVFWSYVQNTNGAPSGMQGTVSTSGYSQFSKSNTVTLNIYGTSGLLSSGRVILSDDGNYTAGPSADVYYSNPQDATAIASFIHSIFQHLPPSSPSSPSADGLTPLNIAQNATLDEITSYITKPSEYARGSVNHWSSSCRIGKCVDINAKVVGTENIFVVDASILSPMTVNPQFAVMVAAELGAERISVS